jgi:DNA-directed RNA polymerase subunit K/omega
LWEWVLSSKYAHPAMFLPKATTSENRSRDKNRPKVEQFQAFIQSRYDKDVLDALPPKYTVQQALDILPYKLVEHAHKVISDNREYAAEQQRVTKMFGVDAVQSIFGTGLSDEDVGIIIRQMQGYLPHKDVRYSLARSNAALARQLAAAAAAAAGFPLGFTRVTDS